MYQLRMLCGSDAETTGKMTMSADMLRAMKKGSGKSAGIVLADANKEPEDKGKRRRRRRRRK